jgi:hypothetical protein
MKKSFSILAALAAAALFAVAAHAGVMPMDALHAVQAHLVNPDVAMGLAGLGAMGITTSVQDGARSTSTRAQQLPAALATCSVRLSSASQQWMPSAAPRARSSLRAS